MIKWICAAIFVGWLFYVVRYLWRDAGRVVDERWSNRNPYINRNDP